MSVLARIRLAIIVLAVGVAAYTAWPAIGKAVGDAKYTTVTASELADEVCSDPNQIDWFGRRPTIEKTVGQCNGNFVPENQTLSTAYLEAHRTSLQRMADDETARQRGAVLPTIMRDLGKPMRNLLLVVTIAVAALILAPLLFRESRLTP